MDKDITYSYELSIYYQNNVERNEFYYNSSCSSEKLLHIFMKHYNYYKIISKWFAYNHEHLNEYMKEADKKECEEWESWKHIRNMFDFTNIDDFLKYFTLYMRKTFIWNKTKYKGLDFHIELRKTKTERTCETINSESL